MIRYASSSLSSSSEILALSFLMCACPTCTWPEIKRDRNDILNLQCTCIHEFLCIYLGGRGGGVLKKFRFLNSNINFAVFTIIQKQIINPDVLDL